MSTLIREIYPVRGIQLQWIEAFDSRFTPPMVSPNIMPDDDDEEEEDEDDTHAEISTNHFFPSNVACHHIFNSAIFHS